MFHRGAARADAPPEIAGQAPSRIAVGSDGFTGGLPNLVAWAAFILFGVIATIAALRRRTDDQPAGPQSQQNRLTRN